MGSALTTQKFEETANDAWVVMADVGDSVRTVGPSPTVDDFKEHCQDKPLDVIRALATSHGCSEHWQGRRQCAQLKFMCPIM